MSKEVRIAVECVACQATGLYQGFAEKRGEATVCLSCDGTGGVILFYTPFVKRKRLRRLGKGKVPIRYVRRPLVTSLTTVGDFYAGKVPK